jgi:hypothetical protein
MRCSDCKLFRTDECTENPGGKDLDNAENFACFVPGGEGRKPVEEVQPQPAAKPVRERKLSKEPKPEPAVKAEKKRKVEEARPRPVKAEKEPRKAKEAKPEPVAKAAEVKIDQRRKRKPSAVAATGGRAPWGWGTLLIMSTVGGMAAAGIVAGVNWKRLGRPALMLPTIIVLALAFVFWLALPKLLAGEVLTILPLSILVNTAVAWGLWQWQQSYHEAWSESNPAPRRYDWLLPALTLGTVWVIVVIVLVAYIVI